MAANVSNQPSQTPHERAGAKRTLTAFSISFFPLVGSSTLSLCLAVLAPMMMTTAQMPAAAFGWIGGAAGLGSVWLYMANSAFTVALGPVRALLMATLIGAGGALLIASGTYALMLAGALLIGFSYATATPAGSQILADHTPAHQRNRIFSLRQTGVPLGGVIAGLVGSALAAQYGWRAALGFITLFMLLSSSILLWTPPHFNERHALSSFRLRRMFALSNFKQPFFTLQETPGLRLIALASIGFASVQGVLNAFFVTFLANGLGYDLRLAGLLFALNQALSVAGRVAYGFVADALGSPRPVLCVLAAFSAGSALAIACLDSGWPLGGLLAVAAFSGLSVATWNGLFMAEVAGLAPERASELSAGATFFVFATYVIVPPLAGLFITWLGFRAAFLMAGACVATTGLALALGWRGAMRGRAAAVPERTPANQR